MGAMFFASTGAVQTRFHTLGVRIAAHPDWFEEELTQVCHSSSKTKPSLLLPILIICIILLVVVVVPLVVVHLFPQPMCMSTSVWALFRYHLENISHT